MIKRVLVGGHQQTAIISEGKRSWVRTMWAKPNGLIGILFDKDGTLIDYYQSWTQTNLNAAKIASNGDISLEREILAVCGTDPETGVTMADSLFASGNTAEIAKRMCELGSRFSQPELTNILDDLFVSGVKDAVPLTDIGKLFEKLKSSGFLLGIASSDSEASIRETLNKFGVEDHVEFIAGYDSGYGAKPEPGMVLAFCRHISCQPSKVLMVGDNSHDLVMGKSAGCAGNIGVLSGTGTTTSLGSLADVLLPSVDDLPSLLSC